MRRARLAYPALGPALLVAAALALLSGCFIFTKAVAKPTVDVRDVSIGAVSFTGVEGELRLDVTNPNGFGVPLAGIDWELSIGTASAVSGTIDLSQTIPAHGVAPVTATLRIDAARAVGVGAELARGAHTYTLSARVRFTSPMGPIAVDVAHQGELSDGARALDVLGAR